ncbi:thioesterase II family protein [Saccharothrix longispora]|uniref:thioesterase II family protein n=1 Tax=Saccharothrix longispora TaxID=33920 RepID=UPI0028FDA515|nr:thioesterase domain-containing protein [Saccharothrix longispora]MDU0287723.1 alpha/beta fold hydrolase [Saccharothrix longispora]
MSGRWLRTHAPRDDASVRLLCFHYAGGNAAMFRQWHALLPGDVEPVAVQLPGRDDRHAEPPYDEMGPLVAALLPAVVPLLDRPYACYGFSMGARVALELVHALRARGFPLPVRLFVASSAAPSLRLPVRGWSEPDEGLIAYLRELGGTPTAVFDHPELLELFLPVVRADLAVVGRHDPPSRAPLDVPIRAFAGADDTGASPERMAPWRAETSAAFDLTVVPGAHFFTDDGLRQVLRTAAEDLLAVDPSGQ